MPAEEQQTNDMVAIRAALASIEAQADSLSKDIRDDVIGPLAAIPGLLEDIQWVKGKLSGNGDPGLLSDHRALDARVVTLENDEDFVKHPVVIEVPKVETDRIRYQRLLAYTAIATMGGALALLFSQMWATFAHFLQQ